MQPLIHIESDYVSPTVNPNMHELDSRTNDGIQVRLLWDADRNQVFVAVADERSGESFAFEVDGDDAIAAFHHPFAKLDDSIVAVP